MFFRRCTGPTIAELEARITALEARLRAAEPPPPPVEETGAALESALASLGRVIAKASAAKERETLSDAAD